MKVELNMFPTVQHLKILALNTLSANIGGAYSSLVVAVALVMCSLSRPTGIRLGALVQAAHQRQEGIHGLLLQVVGVLPVDGDPGHEEVRGLQGGRLLGVLVHQLVALVPVHTAHNTAPLQAGLVQSQTGLRRLDDINGGLHTVDDLEGGTSCHVQQTSLNHVA